MSTGQPTASPDVSLKLRLDALRKSLCQISGVDEAVRGRREEARVLHESTLGVSGLVWSLEDLETAIKNLNKGILVLAGQPGAPEKVAERVKNELQAAELGIAEAAEQCTAIKRIVALMEARWMELERAGALLDEVNTTLSNKCDERIRKVDELKGRLDRGELSEKEVWKDYEDLAYRDGERLFAGEPLFAEYVDYLGGVALRNTGIDEGVCHMADEVLQRCHRMEGNTLWHSMTVPARRVPAESTLARIIRLGFPEWTVWAVPLGAHGFGHVVLAEHDDLKGRIDRSGLRAAPGPLDLYLADVFATYVMGPSYAYASVLLALDPYAPDAPAAGGGNGGAASAGAAVAAEPSPDSRRVHVILETLRCMDETAYDGVRAVLQSYWENALSAFGLAFQFGQGTPSAQGRRRRPEDVGLMVDFLDSSARHLRYKGAQWQRVTRWPELRGCDPGTFPLDPSKDDIRDVLNAAWHQRMRHPDDAMGLAADQLAQAAQSLWRERLSAKTSASGVGGLELQGDS
jgi:hypothetical protein